MTLIWGYFTSDIWLPVQKAASISHQRVVLILNVALPIQTTGGPKIVCFSSGSPIHGNVIFILKPQSTYGTPDYFGHLGEIWVHYSNNVSCSLRLGCTRLCRLDVTSRGCFMTAMSMTVD